MAVPIHGATVLMIEVQSIRALLLRLKPLQHGDLPR